jgi:hypothetical protein
VVNVEENILGKGAGESDKKEDEGSTGNYESDQASEGAVIDVSEAQKIPDTRHSSRLQSQMEDKVKNQEKQSKKRSLVGTNLSSFNSFAILADGHIARIAEEMGMLIPKDKFDSIDILKDIEIAGHALDK